MPARLRIAHLVAAALVVALPASALAKPGKTGGGTPPPTVLVLHDSGGPYGYIGAEYALMLQNLLGHFDVSVVTKAVTAYAAGDMDGRAATFYLGTTYDEPSYWDAGSPQAQAYAAFLRDAASGTRNLTWVGHNLWRLAWGWDPSWGAVTFSSRFGWEYAGIDSTGGYNRVSYRGVDLLKGVVPHASPGADLTGCTPEADGSYDCAPWLSVARIVDPSRASAVAEAWSTSTGARGAYVTRSPGLWYVGDFPFSYIGEEDRYLALADLLHDMLGVQHAEQHRAMVRFEDVSAATRAADLRAASDVLKNLGLPFGIAAIAVYRDPAGYYTGGVPQEIRLSQSETGTVMKQLADAGASIVQHGTTHQWDGGPNPYNGVSGDDFEFFRVTENADHSLNFLGPVPEDSTRWVQDRISQGQQELKRTGLTAFAWEAPHYAASPADYQTIASTYPVHWGRILYTSPSGKPGRVVGQFFPYPVTDAYGVKVLPETLGDVSPDIWNGYAASTPDDLIRRAQKQLVVRDGFAAFYFHPYLDPAMLDKTAKGVLAAGYTFVSPCSVLATCPSKGKR